MVEGIVTIIVLIISGIAAYLADSKATAKADLEAERQQNERMRIALERKTRYTNELEKTLVSKLSHDELVGVLNRVFGSKDGGSRS
jgi:hypothetical protein